MRVLYSPMRSDEELTYEFNGEKIVARLNGEEDTFDFSGVEDGILTNVETSLSINPILEAKRENGELQVKLLYFHGPDATKEELFPNWIEV